MASQDKIQPQLLKATHNCLTLRRPQVLGGTLLSFMGTFAFGIFAVSPEEKSGLKNKRSFCKLHFNAMKIGIYKINYIADVEKPGNTQYSPGVKRKPLSLRNDLLNKYFLLYNFRRHITVKGTQYLH